VLLPAAAPATEAELAVATPDAVEVHEEYVYLFLIFVPRQGLELLQPIAKIPLELLPAAEPLVDPVLADATPQAVEVHDEYVYLFLIAETPTPFKYPIARLLTIQMSQSVQIQPCSLPFQMVLVM